MLHKLFMQAGYLSFWAGSWLGSAWAGEPSSEPVTIEARVVLADDGTTVAEPEIYVFQKAAPEQVKRLRARDGIAKWQRATEPARVLKLRGAGGPQKPAVIILEGDASAKPGATPMKWLSKTGDVHDVTLSWVRKDDEAEDSDEEEEEEIEAQATIEVQGMKTSDHFIGVECYPVEDAVRKQLRLGDKGLWIEGVVDDSPAAQAGFQQNDVLVAANGKDLKEVADLVNVIDEAKDSEIKFIVIREGKRETIKATPAKRVQGDVIVNVPEPEDHLRILEKIRPGQDANIRFFSPGVVIDDKYEFPEGMKIAITREGKGPAKVVVQRGDDKWTTTSDKLESLPDDVRPHVERMVGGGGPLRMMIRGMPERIQGRGAVAQAAEQARAAAERAVQRAQQAAEGARARARHGAEEAEAEGADAGDRLNRLMGRIEKLFEEKAALIEKLLEEKVEKRIQEKSQAQEDDDES